jgi:hypothetical protein
MQPPEYDRSKRAFDKYIIKHTNASVDPQSTHLGVRDKTAEPHKQILEKFQQLRWKFWST